MDTSSHQAAINTSLNGSDIPPLSSLSHGGGCGCKMSPGLLAPLLKNIKHPSPDARLLVGFEAHDDAAVYDLGQGQGLISTTDFFMPIVDSPYDFGQIAACNALSDVYAMGGRPIMALALLAFPVQKYGTTALGPMMQGAVDICAQAGINLAGGHSIDSVEPIFGLSVNGLLELKNLKTHQGAQVGDVLVLSKPLGVGILAHALKNKMLKAEIYPALLKNMCTLNKVGFLLGQEKGVHTLTDITGFGLLGHTLNMAKASQVFVEYDFKSLPFLPEVQNLFAQGCKPGGATRNWETYREYVELAEDLKELGPLLADPQTSGGLLFSCPENELEKILKRYEDEFTLGATVIGRVKAIPDPKQKARLAIR